MKDRSSENSSESTSRSHTPGGISFNGSVTFNAPMFDIHDNAHVYIAMPDTSGASPSPSGEQAGAEERREDVGDRIRSALQVMEQEEVLKYGYDYAWVMLAMDGTAELPHFKSVQSFLEYLRQTLGLDGLPGESSLSKKVRDTRGRHPNWTFADTDDARECTRRNNVASRFLSLFRKGK